MWLATFNELVQATQCLGRSTFRKPFLESLRLLLEEACHLVYVLLCCHRLAATVGAR